MPKLARNKLARAKLDVELDALAEWVPAMLASTDEVAQMNAFADMTETIESAARPDDVAYVLDRAQEILSENCMVPGEDGPCG